MSFEADAIVELGRGTDSVAYLVGGEWVFRFPVAEDAQETLRRELALLPALGPSLPLDIPVFERVGREQGRLLFAGYRVLPGAPLTAERFNGLGSGAQEAVLSSLVGFLEALHAFPVGTARQAGVIEERGKGAYNDQQRRLHHELAHLLTEAEVAHLDGIFGDYERDHVPEELTPVLLHADLKPEHLLYDDAAQRITGVLDWGDMCVGDPDFDLAVISMFFGRDFLLRLLAHLPDRDAGEVLAKAEFFTTVRWLQDVRFDERRGDRRAVLSGLQRLRDHLSAASPSSHAPPGSSRSRGRSSSGGSSHRPGSRAR